MPGSQANYFEVFERFLLDFEASRSFPKKITNMEGKTQEKTIKH